MIQTDITDLVNQINSAIEAHQPFYPSVTAPTYLRLQESIAAFRAALEQSLDAVPPNQTSRREAALALEQHPVFVGGMPKSGTSLLINLLDSHPDLAIFPAEGALFGQTNKYDRLPHQERIDAILGRCFEAIVTTDLGGGPHWLLSGGRPEVDPYRTFIAAFYERVRELPPETNSVYRALIYAYLIAKPGELTERFWVEKTPGNALIVNELRTLYPDARFIFVVRDPRALIASTKGRHLKKYGKFNILTALDSMLATWDSIKQAIDRYPAHVWHLVRYEDVVRGTPVEMKRLAEFLSLEFHDILLRPTVAGLDAHANTGYEQRTDGEVFTESIDRWQKSLSSSEIDFINATVALYASRFGYDIDSVSLLRYIGSVMRLGQHYRRSKGLLFSPRQALIKRIAG